ncbi:MAG: YebC/PmpR family DNA-binding transcriptional regulator [Bradymonadales bacterium]|nr:MAG: YebC/PmpR family DNA-binding transcriptional regulator [Bradymonadales bacterium]
MAGHNKWSKVKRLKAVTDAKKSALYGKYIKEITVAAKLGGADPDGNARLRKAISDAKAQSVPKDNIERALKKAAGESSEAQLEELTYEGYGPQGVAVLVECVTDKRTRTQPELRKIFEKNGGSIAEAGAVAWGFERKGLILVQTDEVTEEKLTEFAVESGAEDIQVASEGYEIITAPTEFLRVYAAFEKEGVKMELAELSFIPLNKVPVAADQLEGLQKLIESLEDHEAVQRVTTNADFG